MQKENNRTADKRRGRIPPITQRRGRYRADQHIANNSAHKRRRERQHHHAEEIEVCIHGRQRAFDGEQKRPRQIHRKQQFAGREDHKERGKNMTRPAANTRPKRSGKGSRAKASIESYSVTAKHYDAAYAVKQDLVDLPFYLDLAKRSGGPVLEIACGTGRVLLPIARQGIAIDGVDNSLPMLSVLKSHIESGPPQVRRRVTLHNGDMRDFRLNKKYPLVIIPFRPLQHMHTVQDQLKALTTAAFHLQKDGILAFDVFYPKFELIPAGLGQEILDLEWQVGKGSVVRRYFRKESVDQINQNFPFTFIFRTYQGDKLVHEESEPFILSYYTYPHLKALFLLAGLEPVAEYGSFAKTPLENTADQMIFLLRRGGPSCPHS